MSRLPGDRNSQQQPQQHNQNQQIIHPSQHQSLHPLRNPSNLQPILTPPSVPLIVINNNSSNDGILRTPSNIVNTVQNSIYYSTPPSASLNNQNLSINAAPVTSQSTPATHLDPVSPIAKKRLKLEVADSSSCGSTNTTEDLSALKKRILEHKLQRLKGLKEKYIFKQVSF